MSNSTSDPNFDAYFNQMIQRSLYFWEILTEGQASIADLSLDPDNQELGYQKLLDRWCQIVAEGNWEIFAKRLQWQGWNPHNLQTDVTAEKVLNEHFNPDWSLTLKQIIQTTTVIGQEQSILMLEQQSCFSSDHPTPFAEVFLPCLQVARQQLHQQLAAITLQEHESPLSLLSQEAYLSLERGLLSELVNLWLRPLMQEFNLVRPFGKNLLSLAGIQVEQSSSKVYYNKFINKILEDGLMSWFQKYPVLGRLTATIIDLWLNSTTQFLRHLHTDLPTIQSEFASSITDNSTRPPGKVVALEPSLSDRHEQGGTVIALTFESGLKLIYKPKSLDLDQVYNNFLHWCNKKNISVDFKVLKVLSHKTHGWVEYVEHQPCEDGAAAQRFYQRAGMLLCVMYLLRGTDCHFENLIASGEYPVLIDTETLMHPEVKAIEDSLEAIEREATTQYKFWDSVLQTGLLPRWEMGTENSLLAYDISGLGSSVPQTGVWRVQVWQHINTDEMKLEWQPGPIPCHRNVPVLNDKPLSAYAYLEDIVSGFQQMYGVFLQHRHELMESRVLAEFQSQRVRLVFRDTRIYTNILDYSLSPKFLQSGLLRSIELDVLSQAFLTATKKPLMWNILMGELHAMGRLDIPYFAGMSDSTTLTVGIEQPIENYFLHPSYTQVCSRLAGLSVSDRDYQTTLIRGTFYARVAQSASSQTSKDTQSFPLPADFKTVPRLSQSELLAAAQTLALEIKDNALWEEDGGVSWIGLAFHAQTERFQFRTLGDSLYHGHAGIALFLSALDHITGTQQYQDLVLGCLKSGRSLLCHSSAALTRRYLSYVGLGGGTGLGSLIYSWVRLSQFTQHADLLNDAVTAAHLITTELIQTDTVLDLIGGVAGTLLGLLALHRATDNQTVLDKAIACGQHLCQSQIQDGVTAGGWATLSNKHPLTGFSHGAAGIAYALLQLYQTTTDQTYLQAAIQGIAYEQRVFNRQVGNWPDFRVGTEANPQFMVSWCHGAPGIGLARLGGLEILDTPDIRQEIAIALDTTQKEVDFSMDHLCCGTMGRVETALVAAEKLARPELLEAELGKVAWLVNRAKATGAYRLFPNIPTAIFNPVFAQGTAGIGYGLLRLAYPNRLPSLLLWE